MPVGFNKARRKVSPARVHGSLGLMPWMALHSRSLASQAHPSLGELIGSGGVNFTPGTASLAPGRKLTQPRGFKRPCSEKTFPGLTLSLLGCDGKSRELSNLSDSKESCQLPSHLSCGPDMGATQDYFLLPTPTSGH